MLLTLALRWSLLQRLLRGFYKTSSCHCVMPQEMRWKHPKTSCGFIQLEHQKNDLFRKLEGSKTTAG
ncbi:unnamed protein product [Arctogadus glacialis]